MAEQANSTSACRSPDRTSQPDACGPIARAAARRRPSPTCPNYLARADAYELDPSLQLREGQQHTAVGQALFGALTDCAPRWGRRLVVRAEQHRARETSARPEGLAEIDYLLGARDDLRQGALRFQEARDDEYLAPNSTEYRTWSTCTAAETPAEELERDQATAEDLRVLLEGASCSAARDQRPRTRHSERLSIAKFRRQPATAGRDPLGARGPHPREARRHSGPGT